MRILNASDTVPVSASYFADPSIELKQNGEYIETYSDGYRLFKSDIFDSMIDVSFNKYSFFGLTSASNITDFLEDTSYTVQLSEPILLISWPDVDNVIGVDATYEFVSVAPSADFAVLYKFEHIETISEVEYYKINYRDKCVTIDGSDEIYLADFTGANNQIFSIEGSTVKYDSFRLKSKSGTYALYNGNDLFLASTDGVEYIRLTTYKRKMLDNYIKIDMDEPAMDNGFNTTVIMDIYGDTQTPSYSPFFKYGEYNGWSYSDPDGLSLNGDGLFTFQRALVPSKNCYVRMDYDAGYAVFDQEDGMLYKPFDLPTQTTENMHLIMEGYFDDTRETGAQDSDPGLFINNRTGYYQNGSISLRKYSSIGDDGFKISLYDLIGAPSGSSGTKYTWTNVPGSPSSDLFDNQLHKFELKVENNALSAWLDNALVVEETHVQPASATYYSAGICAMAVNKSGTTQNTDGRLRRVYYKDDHVEEEFLTLGWNPSDQIWTSQSGSLTATIAPTSADIGYTRFPASNLTTTIGEVFDDQWHNIAFTFDNGVRRTWMDGEFTGTNTHLFDPFNEKGFLCTNPSRRQFLMQIAGQTGNPYQKIGRVIVYNKTLTDEQVQEAIRGDNYHDPIIFHTFSETEGTTFENLGSGLDASFAPSYSAISADFLATEPELQDSRDNGEIDIPGTRLDTEFTGYDTTNRWVKYENFYAPSYSNTSSILEVNDEDSIYDVETSMILTAPVEDVIISGDTATLPINLIPTKNFKTISYEQSIISTSGVSGSDLVAFREYDRIYTGGDRTDGYSNIHLGFSSEYSSIIEFKADEYTYFHVPANTAEVAIQLAGFNYAGAFAGIIPEFSDRIYKRLANYEDTLWWGGGSHNDLVQDGTWLCAWLSAGDDGSGSWVERYYNPGVLDSETAMSEETSGAVDEINFIANPTPVQDITSTMTIEAGAYYKYYHIGSEGLSEILSTLRGINNDNTVLKFTDFNTDNIVNDESDNNNFGTIYNFESSAPVTMDIGFGTENFSALLLNSNADIRVDSSNSLDVEGDMAITTWIYSRDWSVGSSSTILSHYHKSGYKIEHINHGLYYSYIIPNTTVGSEEFIIIPSESTTSGDLISIGDIGGIPNSVAVDSDNYLWVAVYDSTDNESLIFKLTAAGTVLESITLDGINIEQIIIGNENIGYLKSSVGTLYTLDLYSADISVIGGIPQSDYIYMDMSSDIATATLNSEEGSSLDIFNDGAICKINNGDLYIDGVSQPRIGNSEYVHVCCDDDKYLFATTKDLIGDSIGFYKFDRADISTFDSFTLDNAPSAANLSFICKETVENEPTTVIYWVRHDDIVKYYLDGKGEMVPLETITVANPFTGYIDGDYSGYRFNKRADYAYGNFNPYLKATIMLDADTGIISKKILTLQTNEFSDNWHQIVVSKFGENNEIVLYADGERVENLIINPNDNILYFAGSALSIGGAIDGSISLFDILGVTGRTIAGAVSETAIYSSALDDLDVQGLYYSRFNSGAYMRWVLDTGKKNFVEDLQYMFKYKKPGIKSQYFNLVVNNLDVADSEKPAYESHIRSIVADSAPANIKLVKVIWR